MFVPPLTADEVEAAFGGAYRLDAVLEAGGQGAVFRARSTKEDMVALKVYHAEQLEERLARELQALKTIREPTLVRLHEAGSCTIRGQPCRFLATAFIEGRPLNVVLAAEGPQSVDCVARVGRDIASAVERIWKDRIVHRDIKPNNVMLTPEGGAVLIDLGIARHIDRTPLTATGLTWGTRGHLSPEQARGQALTCKSDIFALGVLLQECILGRHPTGRRQELLVNGGVKTDGLRPGLPPVLSRLIDGMVLRNAVYRPGPGSVSGTLMGVLGAQEENHD